MPGGVLLLAGIAMIAVETLDPGLSRVSQVALFAFGTLLVSVGGVILGRSSALASVRDLIGPLAGPPFRRTFSLYDALGRYAQRVEHLRTEVISNADAHGLIEANRVTAGLDILTAAVTEQLKSSNNAADEWAEVVPEKVAAVREAAKEVSAK